MRRAGTVLCLCVVVALVIAPGCGARDARENGDTGASVNPAPEVMEAEMTLDESLEKRRSVRSFTDEELTEEQVLKLAWAAQGVTEPAMGLRTAPSAGALYPLELYVLEAGVLYHYLPGSNSLEEVSGGVSAGDLANAALGQSFISRAPVVFIFTGAFERTRAKYGSRGDRYVYIEVGHAAENLLLKAVALGLGAVPVGAFDDAGVTRVLGLPGDLSPLYIIPVGYPS
ncbi:MAG: SagB/ThcOx family dehydrogenase [Actinobacteria bacterium]|nr:SagB/ThcOx family dehydrogenase [Actinomycetota bacterium]